MAGRSPVVAREEQRHELLTLSQSRERGEADRARALLLTLAGWTSPRIAEAFGVREDTVRLWRSAFMTGGGAGPRRPPPQARRRRSRAGAERGRGGRGGGAPPSPRAGAGADQGRARSGGGRGASVRARGGPSELDAAALGRRDREALGGSRLAVAAVRGAAPKRDFGWRRARPTLKGRQDADAADRAGLGRKLLKAQAEAGDIVLLFGDESEALTHPYLAHVWAKRGADLRIPAPGAARQ